MRVDILDDGVFSAIEPMSLQRYLAINGWHRLREIVDDVAIMGKGIESGRSKLIWLPMNRVLSDYTTLVARLVATVAEVDDKSQLQIIDDLQTVGIGDVIRAATEDILDRHSSTLPLDDGSRLLHQLKQLAIAGASSAVHKRPVYSRRPFRDVRSFVQSLRLAQTEPGSYFMRVVAPLEILETTPVPAMHENSHEQMQISEQMGEVPFSRRAVLELIRGVQTVHSVAMENYSAGRFLFAPFRDSVPQGVSANLCEAIATSYEDSAESPLTVSVTWSYVVTATEDLPTASVRFEPELMPYIREAGREFRRTNPMTVTVRGWVNLMGREGRSGPGSIRLVTRVEGSARTLRVDLPEEAYRLALQAHSEGLLIQITGEFVENLNRYRLDNPRDLFVVHDTDLFSQDVI